MTYLELLSLLILYVAWVTLLLHVTMADDAPSGDGEEWHQFGRP